MAAGYLHWSVDQLTMVKDTLFPVKRFLLCFSKIKISFILFSDEVCGFFLLLLFVLFRKETRCLLVGK